MIPLTSNQMVVIGILATGATAIGLEATGNLSPIVDYLMVNGKTLLKVAQVIGLFIAGYFRRFKLALTLIITLLATEFYLE